MRVREDAVVGGGSLFPSTGRLVDVPEGEGTAGRAVGHKRAGQRGAVGEEEVVRGSSLQNHAKNETTVYKKQRFE